MKLAIDGAAVGVVISVGGTEIYNETLYAVDGVVELYDLAGLVEPYAYKSLVVSLDIALTELDSDGAETGYTESLSSVVIYCSAVVDTTATDFITNYFLTTLQGVRETSMGRLEYLHYIGTEDATATANYSDDSTQDFSLEKIAGNDSYSTVDASPSNFVVDGLTLVGYTVTAGSRKQEYKMNLANPDCAPVLCFENTFGCDELLYCTGTHTLKAEWERSNIRVKGKLQDYKIEESRSKEADTGVLSYEMASWVQDCFRSKYVRLVTFNDGEPQVGEQIAFTETKVEYTNNDDELPRIQFTYEYARKNQHILSIARAGRIFDETFDNTFN